MKNILLALVAVLAIAWALVVSRPAIRGCQSIEYVSYYTIREPRAFCRWAPRGERLESWRHRR